MRRSAGITRIVLTAALAVVSTVAAPSGGQAPAPAFEVSVVKRTAPKPVVPFQIRPGRVVATSVTLESLILRAFQVASWNLVGAPKWISQERFDLEGTFREPATPDQVNAMLRTLLERRFRLVAHTERREMTTDAMVLAAPGKTGPGLNPVRVDCESRRLLDGSGPGLFPSESRPPCGGSVHAIRFMPGGAVVPGKSEDKLAAYTMADFVGYVAWRRGRQAYDRTGLTGQFDIELAYVTDENFVVLANAGRTIDAPRFDVALREQLGIKLEQERNEVEQLIVTSVELPRPEEN